MKAKAFVVLLMAALPFTLPAGAQAQSADTNYCNALTAVYEKYVNNPSGGRGNAPTNAGVGEAKTKCATNPASAIPVLEQALKAARVDLPPRAL